MVMELVVASRSDSTSRVPQDLTVVLFAFFVLFPWLRIALLPSLSKLL